MNTTDLAALRARFDGSAAEPDPREEIGEPDGGIWLCSGHGDPKWFLYASGDDGPRYSWTDWVGFAESILGVTRAEVTALLAETDRQRAIEAATRAYLDADDVFNGDPNLDTRDAMRTRRSILCAALGRR